MPELTGDFGEMVRLYKDENERELKRLAGLRIERWLMHTDSILHYTWCRIVGCPWDEKA